MFLERFNSLASSTAATAVSPLNLLIPNRPTNHPDGARPWRFSACGGKGLRGLPLLVYSTSHNRGQHLTHPLPPPLLPQLFAKSGKNLRYIPWEREEKRKEKNVPLTY